jgi:hypothetical protein
MSDIGMISDGDIFVSDIGITDVDVGYRISPTLRSMSMPTYGKSYSTISQIITKYTGASVPADR